MSLEELTSQDAITIQSQAVATGGTMGSVETYTDAASTTPCLVQEISASEVTTFDCEGQSRTYALYFSSDPSVTKANRIKLSDGTIVRVMGAYTEGRPGETMLWIVEGQEVTSRQES